MVDGIDGVVIDLFVISHLVVIFFKSENDILGVSFSSSSLDLNVRFHAERCIKGNDQIAPRNIKTFLSNRSCDKNSVFFPFEFDKLFKLIVIFLFYLQQHFPHLGNEHSVHFIIENCIICYHATLNMNSVSHLLSFALHENGIVFADCTLVFFC